MTQLGPFHEMPRDVFRRVMEINFFGAVAVTRAVLPALRASRGSLIAISSVAGFAPLVRRTAYAASKHAMEGFFGSLRAEERDSGVHVLVACHPSSPRIRERPNCRMERIDQALPTTRSV